MDAGSLERLGLSHNEAKAYLALLALREAKNAAIATRAGVHRRNCYDALEKLIDRGLAAYRVEAGAKVYRCTSPESLRKLVDEKHEVLESALPDLLKTFAAPPSERDVSILRGFEGMREALGEAVHARRRNYVMVAHELATFANPAYRAAVIGMYKQFYKVPDARMILPDTPLARKRFREWILPHLKTRKGTARIQFRYLGLPIRMATMNVSDDVAYLQLLSVQTNELLFVRFASREFTDFLAGVFEHLWQHARP
jgi:sugar-specific transcriptional regulator TrmB